MGLDLTGMQFGALTALRKVARLSDTGAICGYDWICRCVCGKETIPRKYQHLKKAANRSAVCYCRRSRKIREELAAIDSSICAACHETKKTTEFSRRGKYLMPYCKACNNIRTAKTKEETKRQNERRKLSYPNAVKEANRTANLKRFYGLTIEEYESMRASCGDACEICRLPRNPSLDYQLCVDHDHDTRVIRGLLCDKCNRGLGLLGDDEMTLKRAIEYLNKPRTDPKLVPLTASRRNKG